MINVIVTRSMVYGGLLTICRKYRKVKQSELGVALNITPASISRYEAGISELTINYLYELTNILKIPLSKFVTVAEFIIADLNSSNNANIGRTTLCPVKPNASNMGLLFFSKYGEQLHDLLEG